MKPRPPRNAALLGLGAVLVSALTLVGDAGAQPAGTAHTVFMTAIEIKGVTTADKLPPPSVDPSNLPKGYGSSRLGPPFALRGLDTSRIRLSC